MDNLANQDTRITESYLHPLEQVVCNQFNFIRLELYQLFSQINTINVNINTELPHFGLLHTPERYIFQIKPLCTKYLGPFVESNHVGSVFKGIYTVLNNYQRQAIQLDEVYKLHRHGCEHWFFSELNACQLHIVKIQQQQVALLQQTHHTALTDMRETVSSNSCVQNDQNLHAAFVDAPSQYVPTISNQQHEVHQVVIQTLNYLIKDMVQVEETIFSQFEKAQHGKMLLPQHDAFNNLVAQTKESVSAFEYRLKMGSKQLLRYLYRVHNTSVQHIERQERYKMQLSSYSVALKKYIQNPDHEVCVMNIDHNNSQTQLYGTQILDDTDQIKPHHVEGKIPIASLLNY